MSIDEHHSEANPSGLLNLLFDNDIIYQLSYQMAIQAIKYNLLILGYFALKNK